jgi:hypothetical protein
MVGGNYAHPEVPSVLECFSLEKSVFAEKFLFSLMIEE